MTSSKKAEAVASQWVPLEKTLVLGQRPLQPGTDTSTLSRFGDDRWDMTPAVFAPHNERRTLPFQYIHPDYQHALKRVCWLMLNYDGNDLGLTRMSIRPPSVMTIWSGLKHLRAFADWLVARGCRRFADVTAADLDDYVVAVKDAEVSHGVQEDMLGAVVKIWIYRRLMDEHDRLPEAPPWNGERLYRLLERRRNQQITTPRIPPARMNAILAWSLRFVEQLAPDITAAAREDVRLADLNRPGQVRSGRYRRGNGDIAREVRALVRAFGRLQIPLPGTISLDTGELDFNYGYLTRVLGAYVVSVRRPEIRAILQDSGLPLKEGSPLLVTVSGEIDGQCWRKDPIDESEARPLARHLMAACFIVIGYLSGMRPAEVLSLERGCLQRDPNGLLLLRGRHWKTVYDADGEHIPQGEIRPDPWVVGEPVATAIEVLEQLHDEQLLFPNRLGARAITGARFRDGRARAGAHMCRDMNAFIAWVNAYCRSTGRSDAIPEDPQHPSVQPRQLRRTLAWYIARKPRGIVAAAIQYGHLKVQMTLGYAGTYASGFPDDLAFEEWLVRLETLSEAHDQLASGEHVSGPAADTYRRRVQSAQRFAGRVLTTHRDTQTLLGNPDVQIYPGIGLTCVLDPQRAACRIQRDENDTRHTPDLSDCRPNCANIARTDRDIAVLQNQAAQLATLVQDPLAPGPRTARERHELQRLQTIIDNHHAGNAGTDEHDRHE